MHCSILFVQVRTRLGTSDLALTTAANFPAFDTAPYTGALAPLAQPLKAAYDAGVAMEVARINIIERKINEIVGQPFACP